MGLVSFLTGKEFHQYPISVTILLVISIKGKMMIVMLFLSKYVAARSSLLSIFFSSCQNCGQCDDREEQACEKMASHTYNYDTVHGDLY